MDVKTVGTEVLHQWLANAFVTASQALGHSKTASNEALVKQYLAELFSRGEDVPEPDKLDEEDEEGFKNKLYELGIFNGPGSH